MDSTSQSLMLLLLSLSQRDVSKIVTGPLSNYTVQYLRHQKDFFGTVFKLEDHVEPEAEELRLGAGKVKLTCVGMGFTNLSKRTT